MREIAVVGMACRFPGGIHDTDSLWQALLDRKVTAGPVPKDRWDVRRHFARDEHAKGKAYVERGNFLTQDVRSIDAEFFNLPPRMAENLDPQQRLLLEVTWEAFETAGLDLTAHAGRQVGVYVGGFMLDHMVTSVMPANRSRNNANTAAGMMMTMLSNRLSHAFDLRGPSMSIDTACSSSLVAFVYACQDIWAGRAEMALVGGANVMTRPEYPIGMSKGHFLSRDGQCKSFDARGDGYGRAEGAGAVLLKPLEDALRDGDPILAVVEGAGVNSDGRTPGISMPSAEAQSALIAEVCERHRVDPSKIHYVECHGTGTAVGDPIEVKSVGSIYGKGRSADDRVVVGSIKSNVGHMEAAAGVAGVIKAVLTAQKRLAPPLGNFETPHPDIPFDELGVRLPIESVPLGRGNEDIRVAVNSFGYGGTNAHITMRSYARADTRSAGSVTSARAPNGSPWMLPLSTRNDAALKAKAVAIRETLVDPAQNLEDIIYTASRRRAHLSHRALVMGRDRESLVSALDAFIAGEKSQHVATGVQAFQGLRKPVWVLTGMGPQWWAMGKQLYSESRIFKETADRADEAFRVIAGFSIVEEMLKPEAESKITRTELAQPANFVVQIGLAAMLRAAGVEPGAYVGHSVGEVSAAYLSGVLSLEDALRVSCFRARLQATTAGSGSMLAVGATPAALESHLAETGGLVEVAAINGPATLTLSGDTTALDKLAERLTKEGVFNRKLAVEVPYHSYLMKPIMAALTKQLQGIVVRPAHTPVYSTVSGAQVQGDDFGAAYWQHNVREPVRFMAAIGTLLDAGYNCFTEVGPHPVLASALRDIAKSRSKDIRQIETLRRGEAESARVELAAAATFAEGCDIDWASIAPRGRQISLPAYPWQRERLWLESDRSTMERIGTGTWPLLGIQSVPASAIWQNDLEAEPLAYLYDHVIMGRALMPAAAYIESLLELSASLEPEATGWILRDAQIHAPLLLDRDRAVDFMTSYSEAHAHATVRSVESGSIGQGQLHMAATVGTLKPGPQAVIDLQTLRAQFEAATPSTPVESFYEALAGMGLAYGPRFRALRSVWQDKARNQILAHIELGEDEAAQASLYLAHPAALDACFQTLVGLISGGESAFLPTGFGELRLFGSLPASFWCHARLVESTAKHVDCDLTLVDESGRTLVKIDRFRLTASSAKIARTDKWGDSVKLAILRYGWTDGERTEPKRLGHWMVVAPKDDDGVDAVAQGIDAFGGNVVARVEPSGDLATAAAQLQQAGKLDGFVLFADTAGDATGTRALESLAAYSRALAQLPVADRCRAYVVTRGAFATRDGEIVEPACTALNGFVRVAFNELEGVRMTTVDLPRQPEQDDWDSLVLELVCDEEADEVALRGHRRLFSTLDLRNDSLTVPRVAQLAPSHHAFRVRGVPDDDPTPQTVLLTELPEQVLGESDIAVEVEILTLPLSALTRVGDQPLDEPFVEIVGKITAKGDGVHDLAVGSRIYGLAPAEVANRLQGSRDTFHVVEIGAAQSARRLLLAGVEHAAAEQVSQHAALGEGSVALCATDSQSLAVGAALARRGVRVVYFGEGAEDVTGKIYPDTHHGIDEAKREQAPAGFEAIITPIVGWIGTHGWSHAAPGFLLIDTSPRAQPIALPAKAQSLLRTDLRVLTQRPAVFSRALRQAVEAAGSPDSREADLFGTSVADLTRERLTLPNADIRLSLRFDDSLPTLPMARSERIGFRADATYLITGGLGGFGQRTAEWLVDHGARHIVLTGRNGADTPERKAFVQHLEGRQVEVVCAAVDVADQRAMADLIDTIGAKMPPLKGVFHSTVVLMDEPVAELSFTALRATMRSKAEGARVLHELTRKLTLDHFVMFSSIANLVGNSRQAGYAAANGYLDGLAWRRHAEGLPALSINWGVISDVGIVNRDERLEQFLRYVSLRGMDSAEALDLLGRAMLRDVPQVGITLLHNWAAWARYEIIGGTSPRFAALIAGDTKSESGVKDQIRAELSALPPGERLDALCGLIAALIAGELDSEAASIPMDRPIPDLGVDSLMATSIQSGLDSELGISVAVLDLLGDATIRTIADKALAQFELIAQAA